MWPRTGPSLYYYQDIHVNTVYTRRYSMKQPLIAYKDMFRVNEALII